MAMNLGPQDDEDIIGTINTTPLVDVMLVLLIIFLITIPVVTTSVKVDLPQENNVPRETQPENLIVSVDAAGHIFLYDTPLASSQALFERLSPLATRKPQPEVQPTKSTKATVTSATTIIAKDTATEAPTAITPWNMWPSDCPMGPLKWPTSLS